MSPYREVMADIGLVVDAIGVLAIFVGAVFSTAKFLLRKYGQGTAAYQTYRQNVGRAILLGLEFLIAGDIVKTVVFAPTLQNLAVLAIIVLIRTFLSTSLQLELEGRWPWQSPSHE